MAISDSGTESIIVLRHDLTLAGALDMLVPCGFRVVEIDAATITTTEALLDALAAALQFPSWFGRNLDAFEDCLRDVVTPELVLVLRHYGAFAALRPDAAQSIIDIIAGQQVVCLVQVDEPQPKG